MATTNFTGLHALYISKVDQETLILAIEFFQNNLPESLSGNVRHNIVCWIIASLLVLLCPRERTAG